MKTVLSISGGMDSTCLLIKLLAQNKDVYLFSFDYGQKHKLELERLDQNLEYLKSKNFKFKHTRIDLRSAMASLRSALTSSDLEMPKGHYADENMKKTVVPNRNAIFSSIIYAQAQSLANTFEEDVEIALGVHSGDFSVYPDCREDFYEKLENAFKNGNWNSEKVSFYLPYINVFKEDILHSCFNDCIKLNLDFDTVLANTNTSYLPDAEGKANGRTGSDVERILAFYKIGRVDPVEYQDTWHNVLKWALAEEHKYMENHHAE
jgi:7-cyano-7-deazaguanine synthase